MLYKARKEAIKFFDDYSLMVSDAKNEAKIEATKGTGIKILTPKQSKEITKKVYNNIIKSIQ